MLKILSKVFFIVFTKNVYKVLALLFCACFISGCSSLKQNNDVMQGFKVVLGILTVVWLFFIVYALISYLLEFPTPIEAAVVGVGSLNLNVKQLVFRYFALSA